MSNAKPLSAAKALNDAKRIVIKVGSALLVDEQGEIRADWLKGLIQDIHALRKQNKDVLLVSSGAIAVGRKPLALTFGSSLRLDEKQAAAATGQILLAHAYHSTMALFGYTAAQVLLTLSDTEDRRRHLNARDTLSTLLKLGAIPVINENDTVATTEIRYGDNDRLAARVSTMVGADMLVLLSDIDGLYTHNPKTDPKAAHIPVIHCIDDKIEAMAEKPVSAVGSGGMITKIMAAKIAVNAGTQMIIAQGNRANPIQAITDEQPASLFLTQTTPLQARKTWIAGTLSTQGKIIIDQGASHALHQGSSLLPVGVISIEGNFESGDAVGIFDANKRELARGLSSYSSQDALAILGHHSDKIQQILGHKGRPALVHRDNLVLL